VLLLQIQTATRDAQQEKKILPAGFPKARSIILEFESKPDFELTIRSLDLPSKGIELLSVRHEEVDSQRMVTATVFVPNDQVSLFIKKIEEYRDQQTRTNRPKNAALIDSIEKIRLATVKSLWTDLEEVFPDEDQFIWWEVWLRAETDAIPKFQRYAQLLDISVSSRSLTFPDRHVILAYATSEQFANAITSINVIAELRRAKETTADFLKMPNIEQAEWAQSLAGLTDRPDVHSPVVCILDTGIQRRHPLLTPFLEEAKILTCNPTWGTHDHHGHGTAIAGMVLYGDLELALMRTNRLPVPCNLESVKILPPNGQNAPELYGMITEEAVNRATIADPDRNRIVCMAVTATDSRDRGQPSSWSASIDRICCGETIGDRKHLVILSAGNVASERHIDYPAGNLTDGIHDPGQSWNALTVGAFTEKADITETGFAGWSPLAPAGDIAPGTTTSLTWQRNKWPIKPDVVFEGGNAAISPDRAKVDHPNSLLLLTTNRIPESALFTYTADTSAAAAKAAHMASQISTAYCDYWPETIRALIAHSAEWTPQMRETYPTGQKNSRESLLRTCGLGVPDVNRALWSASNCLTLVVQESLRPFEGNSMHEMVIHDIPWPARALQDLGDTTVKMRVTLSYFIEPNPARRGWEHKFRYQSHGLRFEVKTPTETIREFSTRLNRERWDEGAGRASATSSSDTAAWFFGKQTRSRGSLHTDIWTGSAVELAERNHIAVFPVVGWWREKQAEGHSEKAARYCLIVSISTPEIEADIYTAVENMVAASIHT
jgi:hypothetical protein